MSSQGQRFRRRAVRRGYKVDEVDDFLDRVEATLNGVSGAAVSAQDVHEVVFRVRFGGYDEWQVDLHLDRVERQLAELQERPPAPSRGAELRVALGQGGSPGGDRGPDRTGPPPLPTRIPAAVTPTSGMPRYDQPRYDEPTYNGGQPSPRFDEPAYNAGGQLPQRFDEQPAYNGGQPSQRFDEPAYNGGGQPRYDEPTFMAGPPKGQPPAFDGYDQQRPPRQEPTGDIRMDRRPEPSRDSFGPPPGGFGGGQQPMQPPQAAQPGYGQPGGGFGGPGGSGGFGGPPPAAAPSFGPEAQRIDQLRRTFQLRRFGSGYDPAQVDRIFEGVLGTLSGRGPGGVGEAELDPGRLNLVPGGYYEAEVEQALREARDILGRR